MLAVPFAAIARYAQPAHLKLSLPFWKRLLIAGDALAFLPQSTLSGRKTLALYYGRNPAYVLQHHFIWWTWTLPAVLITALWLNRRRCAPALAGMAIFVAGLIPVLGFVGFSFQYYSTVADRYLYLSMFGIALIAAWTLDHLSRRWCIMAAMVLVVLAQHAPCNSLTGRIRWRCWGMHWKAIRICSGKCKLRRRTGI